MYVFEMYLLFKFLGYHEFMKHLSKEFCIENLLFFTMMLQLKDWLVYHQLIDIIVRYDAHTPTSPTSPTSPSQSHAQAAVVSDQFGILGARNILLPPNVPNSPLFGNYSRSNLKRHGPGKPNKRNKGLVSRPSLSTTKNFNVNKSQKANLAKTTSHNKKIGLTFNIASKANHSTTSTIATIATNGNENSKTCTTTPAENVEKLKIDDDNTNANTVNSSDDEQNKTNTSGFSSSEDEQKQRFDESKPLSLAKNINGVDCNYTRRSESNNNNKALTKFFKIFEIIYKQYIEAEYAPLELNISYEERSQLKSYYNHVLLAKQQTMNQYDQCDQDNVHVNVCGLNHELLLQIWKMLVQTTDSVIEMLIVSAIRFCK